MFTGSNDTAGSTGARASTINSVISAPAGNVQDAPASLLGDNLPECGFNPSNLSLEPNIPSPDQSNRLIPISDAVITGSSIIMLLLPSTLISIVKLEISAPGANSSAQFALACKPILGSAPTASS